MTRSVCCVAARSRTRLNSSINSRNGVDFRPDEGSRYIVKTRTIDAARTGRITTSTPLKDWAGMGVVGHRWNYVHHTNSAVSSVASRKVAEVISVSGLYDSIISVSEPCLSQADYVNTAYGGVVRDGSGLVAD